MKYVIGVLALAAAVFAGEGEKPRVYVATSDSWEMGGPGRNKGGAAPQTAEIIKTLNDKCGAAVQITNNKDRADFILTMEHDGGKGWARRDTKYAVFMKDGDMLASGSARSIGGGIEAACRAITK